MQVAAACRAAGRYRLPLVFRHRQRQGHGRSLFRYGFEAKRSAMLLYDPGRDRQPEAGAAAVALGGEERIKEVLEMLFGDADPLVCYPDHDRLFPFVVGGAQRDPLRHIRQRLAGIEDQVHDHLLDSLAVAEYFGERLGVIHRKVPGRRADGRVDQPESRLYRIVDVDQLLLPGIVAPGKILEVIDDPLDPFGAVLHLVEDARDFGAHFGIGDAAQHEIAMLAVKIFQDLSGIVMDPFQDWNVEQHQAVRIVDLVGDAGDQGAERGHLVGLDKLVLMAAQLFQRLVPFRHLLCQLGGPGGDPYLQGPGPEHRDGQDDQQGDQDHGPVLEGHGFRDARRLVHAEPFVIDGLVLTGLVQDRQTFAEAGQKFTVPLGNAVAVLLADHRSGHRHEIGEVQLPYQVHARNHGDDRIVVLTRGEQPERLRRRRGEDQVLAEAHPVQDLMHDAVAEHDDLFAAEFLQGSDRRRFPAGKDGVVDDGMGWGEVDGTGPGI